MKGTLHKFMGEWGEKLEWAGARSRNYDSEVAAGVTETWLIGKAEQARNFALRYYEIEKDGYSRKEQHEHDHGIVISPGLSNRIDDLLDEVSGKHHVLVVPSTHVPHVVLGG